MPQFKFQYLTETFKGTKFWMKLYIWARDVDEAKLEAEERMKGKPIYETLYPEEV